MIPIHLMPFFAACVHDAPQSYRPRFDHPWRQRPVVGRRAGGSTPELRKDALAHVRAHFIVRGTFLHHWARQNGFATPTVTVTLQGHRHGPKSREIIARLREDGAL